jgi:uncharacterized membrane protein YkoI
MQPNKRMSKSTAILLALGMFGTGAVGSIGYQVYAQTSSMSDSAEMSAEYLADPVDDDAHEADEVDEVEPALPAGGITEQQARSLIMASHPGVTIMNIELEDENGVLLYGAELSDDTEVNVDAVTGQVTLDPEDADDADDEENDD